MAVSEVVNNNDIQPWKNGDFYTVTASKEIVTPIELVSDGTVLQPSYSFISEQNTGLYKITTGDVGLSVQGKKVLDILGPNVRINNDAANYQGPLTASLTGNAPQAFDVGNTIITAAGSGARVEIKDQNIGSSQPPILSFGTGLGGDIQVNGKKAVQLYDNNGGLLTSVITGTQLVVPNAATDGFLYIPAMIGTPTGVPTLFLGQAPMVLDSPGQKLWINCNGGWHGVALV